MVSYQDFTRYFGAGLYELPFQQFLSAYFKDLTEYNILESEYIVSELMGIEIGFTNNDAVYDDDDSEVLKKGNPLFSHFIIYPKAVALISVLPFGATFDDKRNVVLNKAGQPTQTNQGFSSLLRKDFLVDNYKINEIVVTFDYNVEQNSINFIQLRDNNLQEQLRL